ncbi:MAG: hypothetical protein WD872_06840 [Pirellulaceae bacterium]
MRERSTIPEAAVVPLSEAIRMLRFIVFMMAAGVVVFGGISIWINWGKPLVLAGKLHPLSLGMLIFGAVQLVLGFALPPILIRNLPVQPKAEAALGAHKPDVARVLTLQAKIQTSTIIGCALLEGGAFGNLVAYFTTGELLNLGMAGVLLCGIVAYFPWPGACERRIENELWLHADREMLKT